MNSRQNRQKNREHGRSLGFTLAEVMVVVAILAVLAAVAVPGVVYLKKRLKQMELDDTARTIYVAAQNSMTRLKVSGGLEKLASGEPISVPYDAGTESSGGESSEENDDARYYVAHWTGGGSSEEDIMSLLLPSDSIDATVFGGNIAIEYDIETASVYAVFYDEGAAKTTFQYDSGANEAALGLRTNRNSRLPVCVGYYSGGMQAGKGAAICKTPELTVQNDDVLSVTIGGAESDYTVTVWVKDSAGNSVEISSSSSEWSGWFVKNDDDTYTLTLDTLTSGKQFKDGFSTLTAGSDLMVTAELSREGEISSSASAKVNSLFASGEDDGSGGINAVINCARHLQNLSTSWSGAGVSVTSAMQTASINWQEAVSGAGRTDTAFQSIVNSSLKSYDGSMCEIQYLSGTNGLFSSVTGTTLKNICLVNPKIENSNSEAVGTLAGSIIDGKIENCRVYVSDDVSYNEKSSYGLTANGDAGGLAGMVSNCTITDSFAALPVFHGSAAAAAGGLVGNAATGSKIKNCYAACDDFTGTGLLTGAGSADITGCYAMGFGIGTVSFAGGGNIRSSYYAYEQTGSGISYGVYDGSGAVQAASGQSAFLTALNGLATFVNSAGAESYPYKEELDDEAFPYLFVQTADGEILPHYGSWPGSSGYQVTVNLEIAEEYRGWFDENMELGSVTLSEMETAADGTTTPVQIYPLTGTETSGNDTDSQTASTTGGKTLRVIYVPTDSLEGAFTASAVYKYKDSEQEYSVEMTTAEGENPSGNFIMPESDIILTVTLAPAKFKLMVWNEQPNWAETATVKYDDNKDSINITGTKGTVLVFYGQTITVTAKGVTMDGTASETYQPTVTLDGNSLPQSSGEKYTGIMPAKDCDLVVNFTADRVVYYIEYYSQKTDGEYPDTANKKIGPLNAASSTVFDPQQYISGDDVTQYTKVNGKTVYQYDSYKVLGNDGTELQVNTEDDTYIFNSSGENTQKVTIQIYFTREKFKVTLVPGTGIAAVAFRTEADGTVSPDSKEGNTVVREYYWDEMVYITCTTLDGRTFTKWDYTDFRDYVQEPSDQLPEFSFKLGANDVTLTAVADDQTLVHIDVLKDREEIWLDYLTEGKDIYLVDKDDSTHSFKLTKYAGYAEGNVDAGYSYRIAYGEGNTDYYCGRFTSPISLTVTNTNVSMNMYFYTVTYYSGGADSGTVPEGGIYPYGSNVKVSPNTGSLRKKGRAFIGWEDWIGKKEYLVNTSPSINDGTVYIERIAKKTNLTAQWENSAVVIYDGNGADEDSVIPVEPGTSGTFMPATVNSSTFHRAGYIFVTWNTEPDGSGVKYDPGKQGGYPFPEGALTLYAIWSGQVEVKFYSEESCSNLCYSASSAERGKYYTIPSEAASSLTFPEGKWFGGWKCKGNSGGKTVYQTGDSLLLTESEYQFYPVWYSGTQFTVNYYGYNGTSLLGTVYVQAGSLTIQHAAPTDGSSGGFVGWQDITENSDNEVYYCKDGVALKTLEVSATRYPEKVIKLKAISCKVWNYTLKTAHPSLYEAVQGAQKDNILIFFDSTDEPQNFVIDKNLYIISAGDYTADWSNATFNKRRNDTYSLSKESCITISPSCEVQLGAEGISEDVAIYGKYDGTLTFDAGERGRLICVCGSAVLYQYDGVTLEHGKPSYSATDGSSKSYAQYGGGVFVYDGGEFYMRGGSIESCSAGRGGGVYLLSGSHMAMGKMIAATKPYSSSTLYYKKGEKDVYELVGAGEVTNSNIENTGSDGSALYYVASGSPEIAYNNAGTCGTGYWAKDGGGGLFLKDLDSNDMLLYSGSVHNNEAAGYGGGILTDSSDKDVELYIYEVEIAHNKALYGGGLFQWEGTIVVYNADIVSNSAETMGGGIGLIRDVENKQTSDIEFYFGSISHNTAGTNGGGVYICGGSEMKMYGANEAANPPELTDNRAGGLGGGVYVKDNGIWDGSTNGQQTGNGSLSMAGSSIYGNYDTNIARANDVYLAGNTYITVPKEMLHLKVRFNGDLVDENIRTIFDCGGLDGTSSRKVVGYENNKSYQSSDCNYFQFSPADTNYSNYRLLPNDAETQLELRTGSASASSALSVTYHTGSEGRMPGTLLTQQTTQYASGTVETFPVPELTDDTSGTVFQGWSTVEGNINGRVSEPWTPESSIKSIDLYALWGQNHQLTYSIGTDALSAGLTAPEGGSVSSAVIGKPSEDYYTLDGANRWFYGWTTTENGMAADSAYSPGKEIALKDDLTLYAVWSNEAPTYTVTFMNGETTVKTQSVPYGENAAPPEDSDVEIPVGYDLSWSGNYENVTADVVIYAVFTARQSTITFCNADGTQIQTQSYTIEDEQTLADLCTPTAPLDDEVFDCWVASAVSEPGNGWTDGGTYTSETPVKGKSGNVTLTAQWSDKKYTIKFNKKVDRAEGKMEEQVFTIEDVRNGGCLYLNCYTLEQPASWGQDRYDHNVCIGWTTDAKGKGEVLGLATPLSKIVKVIETEGTEETITLYAKYNYCYNAGLTYTIHYVSNGGSGTMADQTWTKTEIEKTLSNNKFEREGYKFTGWKDSFDNSYNSGARIYDLVKTFVNAEVWLYAQWAEQ